jgi:hypothetical protein
MKTVLGESLSSIFPHFLIFSHLLQIFDPAELIGIGFSGFQVSQSGYHDFLGLGGTRTVDRFC